MEGHEDHAPASWLQRLGLAQRRGSRGQHAAADDSLQTQRQQMLDRVSGFLLDHHLPVNAVSLGIAYKFVAATDPRIVRATRERIAASEPLTMDWLETLASDSNASPATEQLHGLVERLESSLAQFADTTSQTRSATNQYSIALEQHARGLQQDLRDSSAPQSDAAMAGQIAELMHDMLDLTRTLESELDRSERESRMLEASLAAARREADLDYLTGLPNRRAFETTLEREVALAIAADEPICVAMCDIDHFKRINDEHGHDAGDRILRTVAQSLVELLPAECYVARHGGEEFAIVLRRHGLEQATEALNVAREGFARRRLINQSNGRPFGRVSFSVGVADVRLHANPLHALRSADLALYEAKSVGRNCVVGASAVLE